MIKYIKNIVLFGVDKCCYIRGKILGHTKILFYGLNMMNYNMFKPIKDNIEHISDTEIYYCFKDMNINYLQYLSIGIKKNKLLSITNARLGLWDAIIMADFIKPKYLFPNKLIYICHGVAAKKWSYLDDKGILRTDDYRYNVGMKEFDYAFFHNEIDLKNSKIRGLWKNENTGKNVGMCCLDEMILNNNNKYIETIKNIYIPKDYQEKNIVMYAPTWDDTASFKRKGMEILKALSCLDAFVIIKPHPLCITSNVGNSGLDLQGFLNKIFINNNYIVVTDTPYKIMPIVDVMIGDFGSISFEFTLLRRPLYLFEGIDIFDKIADIKQYNLLKKCCFMFYEKDEINSDTFSFPLIDSDKLAAMELLQELCFSNVGSATEHAVKHLIENGVVIKTT